jgi:hypothetical protein
MDPDRVYISTAHTAAVAEAATISKDRALLTLFQIGARHSGERDYSLSIKSLRQWVRAVKPKQLHVVYFTNWASKNACGFGVKGCKDDNAVSRKLFDGQKGMFSSYIIRGGIYRDVPEVVLVGHNGRYATLLAQYTTAEERGQTVRVGGMRGVVPVKGAVISLTVASLLAFAGPVRETAERVYEATAGGPGRGGWKGFGGERPQARAGAESALLAEGPLIQSSGCRH